MCISQPAEKVHSDMIEESSCSSKCMSLRHDEFSMLFDDIEETSTNVNNGSELVKCSITPDNHMDEYDECDGASGTDAHMTNRKKGISFGKIQVRCYERILGDHPLCRKGPPLTFCWTPERDELWDFEEYQQHHHCRRKRSAFRLSPDEREEILEEVRQDDIFMSGSTQLQALVFACNTQRKYLNESHKPAIHRRSGMLIKHSIQTNSRPTVTRMGRPRMWMPEENSKSPIIGF
mmetsp:Transcript_2037/g.2695  ORF Transcript_2037/g.2695 Transcript_2037/m.2695 type:complete len:234 (-) Transcript_2037:67-768(-)